MSRELNERERRDLRRKARTATLAAIRALGGEAHRTEIVQRAVLDGGFTARELGAPPPPAAAVKHARMVDYQLSWALTNLRRDGLVENPVRCVWRLAGAALEAPERVLDEPVYLDRLDELQRMAYREYLRTPEWRTTRAAALVRADHCCSLDVTHTRDLEVHHRTYSRLGQELVGDLVVLCHDCHKLHHQANGRPRRAAADRAGAAPASRWTAAAQGELTGRPARVSARPRRSLLRRLLAS